MEKLFLLVILSIVSAITQGQRPSTSTSAPLMHDFPHAPVVVGEGQNAVLTCIVRNLGNASVVWKKWENGKAGPKILTANEVRVTADRRVQVIHDEGGDVWVLAIGYAQASDSGAYICEVNSTPVLRSFHNLTVISATIRVPGDDSTGGHQIPPETPTIDPSGDFSFGEFRHSYKGHGSVMSHNYTDCCLRKNVSSSCLGFCTLKTILDGTTGEPNACENEFPKIVSCMADGRDHVPCCIREGIPDLCQDLCRGEYTLVTDNVKTHFSCPSHIENTLSCIADGVEILPSEPLDLDSMALSSSSINISWSVPLENGDTVTEYVVNVTKLRSFDAPFIGVGYGQADDSSASSAPESGPAGKLSKANGKDSTVQHTQDHANDSYIQAHAASRLNRNNAGTTNTPVVQDENAEDKVEAKMMQVKVDGDLTSVVIQDLLPFTMYEITVRAFNIHGRSLPSVRVRTLTLAPGVNRPSSSGPQPKLPDTKGCCSANGISSPMCVTKLCDARGTVDLEIPDLMICAVHAPTAFTCLANGIDHTPCCRQRGIPSPCTDLCSANFTSRLDFHYFKCLKYMPLYSGCVMEGYGVVPSPPRSLRVSSVQEDFAIIHWSEPSSLSSSVKGYNIHYRPLSTYETEYNVIGNIHSPYILEKLYDNAEYEIYVEAVNEHGSSQPSQRVVFRTESMHLVTAELEAESSRYNETACCEKAGLSDLCMPLCSYDASMSDIRVLALACAPEFHTLLRCAAGGRDHSQCCERRGVAENCIGICSARLPDSLLQMTETCLPFIGNIVQCFEEGADLLPGPVREFHANLITDNSIALSWEAPIESNVSHYEVFYQLADPSLGRDSSTQLYSVNVSQPAVELTNLTTNSTYLLSVVAVNQHGTSVPSSLIQVTISSNQFNGSHIPGVVSAPHSLTVGSHTATWVQIVWQPPLFSHPTDNITYTVYHRNVRDAEYVTNKTSISSISLEQLKPNSQYIIYVTASTEKGESLASETLVAWTDPAHSPYVEAPRIQPVNLLVEGSTMTVFCVALGDPTPTISLYINGRLLKQQKSRHLTEIVNNVTRDMDIVSCLAENGYGAPMQASRRIQISHAPVVSGADITLGAIGDKTLLECTVLARPEPKVAFWHAVKNGSSRVPVVDGGRYTIHLDEPNPLEDSRYIYTLKVVNLTEEDGGDYYCQGDNAFGESTKKMTLRTRLVQNESLNVSACCIRENVSPACIDACNMYLDIDSVIDKPECLPDFNKFMRCAADGRDHRPCCGNKFVPKICSDACHGFPIQFGAETCALKFTKSILSCFHENRELIPGPPINLQYKVISENEILMAWDPPSKNPDAAILYKLFWRRTGEKRSDKIETTNTFAHVPNLKPGVTYEAVVKAVSNQGSSTLTHKLPFSTEDNTIAYASTGGSNPGVGVGVTLLVLLIITAAVGAVWIFRKKQLGPKPIGSIAFENPSYIREPNPDALMNGNGDMPQNGSVSSVSNGLSSHGNGWQSETLHSPRPETEVAPTLYEELRLGTEGAGFRRLK